MGLGSVSERAQQQISIQSYNPELTLTPDQIAYTYAAELMKMKEIDSLTGHGITYKPYTLTGKGEKYIFLATEFARSADYKVLLGFHRYGSQLQGRTIEFKIVDNNNNVVDKYMYADGAREGSFREQESVFVSLEKYFSTCDELMKSVAKYRALDADKTGMDIYDFAYQYKTFYCN